MKVAILGAGGWGTALASVLSQNNISVTIWSFEKSVADEINSNHTNSVYLPNFTINESIIATTNAKDLNDAELVVISTPTQFIRPVLKSNNFNLKNKFILSVAKGIEQSSLMRVSEILYDVAKIKPQIFAVLSGPSHAEEVCKQIPTTVVVASEKNSLAELVQSTFNTKSFRVYTSEDTIGCELGGALKNVIAIAAGIIDGLEFGDNTKAALITRGLAEMTRLGVALGANSLSFSGLSGLGDLFVTCNSKYSRNRFVGEQIGKGKSLEQVLSEMKMVAEGVHTTKSAYLLGQNHKVEMPIIEQVYRVLFEKVKPKKAISDLMARQSKREWWW